MNRLYLMAATAAALTTTTALAADKIDFTRDVKPILEKNCLSCHGEHKPKGGLQLTTRENAIKGGDNKGAALVPKEPLKSPLYVTTTLPPDSEDVMPPKGEKLTKAQTEILKNWIEQGADWPATEVLKPAMKEIAGHLAFYPNRVDKIETTAG